MQFSQAGRILCLTGINVRVLAFSVLSAIANGDFRRCTNANSKMVNFMGHLRGEAEGDVNSPYWNNRFAYCSSFNPQSRVIGAQRGNSVSTVFPNMLVHNLIGTWPRVVFFWFVR